MTFHNVIILIKSVVNHNKNKYFYIFQKKVDIKINECLYIIKLYYDRIDTFEGIDVNKTSASKECDICHYWYFLNYSFKFKPNVYNRYDNAYQT